MLTRWVVVLGLLSGALAVGIAIVATTAVGIASSALGVVALVLVVLGAVGVAWWPRRATRLAWLYVVPAVLVGWLWQTGQTVAAASFGWFAYAPLSTSLVTVSAAPFSWSDGVTLAITVLALLLWTLATLGLITALPTGGSVRVLAVVAAVLTAPLWVPPSGRTWAGTLLVLSGSVAPEVAAVRLAALVLVLAVGIAVVRARGPVPARAAAYVLPAVALTWVGWRTSLGGADVTYAIPGIEAPAGAAVLLEPGAVTWVDTLPWTVATTAEAALVVVLWILTVRGARELMARYRPPTAVEGPVAE